MADAEHVASAFVNMPGQLEDLAFREFNTYGERASVATQEARAHARILRDLVAISCVKNLAEDLAHKVDNGVEFPLPEETAILNEKAKDGERQKRSQVIREGSRGNFSFYRQPGGEGAARQQQQQFGRESQFGRAEDRHQRESQFGREIPRGGACYMPPPSQDAARPSYAPLPLTGGVSQAGPSYSPSYVPPSQHQGEQDPFLEDVTSMMSSQDIDSLAENILPSLLLEEDEKGEKSKSEEEAKKEEKVEEQKLPPAAAVAVAAVARESRPMAGGRISKIKRALSRSKSRQR